MGAQIKLKETAIAILLSELHPTQMIAIYLLASGAEMPESVSKSDLTKIIYVLCTKLDWIREEPETPNTYEQTSTVDTPETLISSDCRSCAMLLLQVIACYDK